MEIFLLLKTAVVDRKTRICRGSFVHFVVPEWHIDQLSGSVTDQADLLRHAVALPSIEC